MLDRLFSRLGDGEKKTRIVMYAAVSTLLAVMILLSVFSLFDTHKIREDDKKEQDDSSTLISYDEGSRSTNDHNGEDAIKVVDHEHRLTELKKKISEKFETYQGTWSAYVKDLNTNDWFVINDHKLYPGSMIKLFALGACYQKIEDGLIKESDYSAYLYNMVVMSNNQAFNNIVWAIGKTYITEWCHAHGYLDTAQYHGLVPSSNAEGLTTEPYDNSTSPCDVGRMLESIYRKECVSEAASEKMLDLLLNQHWTGKIPSGVPDFVKVANKTGDTYDISHDAAIVYSPGGDYIIVIMAEAKDIAFDLDGNFREISAMTYRFFNSDKQ